MVGTTLCTTSITFKKKGCLLPNYGKQDVYKGLDRGGGIRTTEWYGQMSESHISRTNSSWGCTVKTCGAERSQLGFTGWRAWVVVERMVQTTNPHIGTTCPHVEGLPWPGLSRKVHVPGDWGTLKIRQLSDSIRRVKMSLLIKTLNLLLPDTPVPTHWSATNSS